MHKTYIEVTIINFKMPTITIYLDTELYDYVKNTLMEKQRESYGPDFNRDLYRHKEKCHLIKNGRFERLDYKMRVIFEIFTGIIRKINGLPVKGSY